MKILHILPRFRGGGPERHVLQLASLAKGRIRHGTHASGARSAVVGSLDPAGAQGRRSDPGAARPPLPAGDLSPTAGFVASLGDQAGPFEASLAGTPEHGVEEVRVADSAIGESSAVLAQGEGGVVHYRNAYPDDALLRFWAGLIARRAGKSDVADAEFQAAISMGLPTWRAPQNELTP